MVRHLVGTAFGTHFANNGAHAVRRPKVYGVVMHPSWHPLVADDGPVIVLQLVPTHYECSPINATNAILKAAMLNPRAAVARLNAATTCGQPGPHGGKWYHLRGGGCGGVTSVAAIGPTVWAILYQAGSCPGVSCPGCSGSLGSSCGGMYTMASLACPCACPRAPAALLIWRPAIGYTQAGGSWQAPQMARQCLLAAPTCLYPTQRSWHTPWRR